MVGGLVGSERAVTLTTQPAYSISDTNYNHLYTAARAVHGVRAVDMSFYSRHTSLHSTCVVRHIAVQHTNITIRVFCGDGELCYAILDRCGVYY